MSEAIVLNQQEQIVSGQRKRIGGIATITNQDPRSQTFTDADTDEAKPTSSL